MLLSKEEGLSYFLKQPVNLRRQSIKSSKLTHETHDIIFLLLPFKRLKLGIAKTVVIGHKYSQQTKVFPLRVSLQSL